MDSLSSAKSNLSLSEDCSSPCTVCHDVRLAVMKYFLPVISEKRVGNVYSKAKSFVDYVRRALRKLDLDDSKVAIFHISNSSFEMPRGPVSVICRAGCLGDSPLMMHFNLAALRRGHSAVPRRARASPARNARFQSGEPFSRRVGIFSPACS